MMRAKVPLPRLPISNPVAAASFSTAHDYMRFCRMMLHGGALDGVQNP